MKLKLSTIFTLLLLLLGSFSLTFKIEEVKASGTIYIRADGSIYPIAAPISTIDNLTYTITGNINNSIVVERDNIVLDGQGHLVEGTFDSAGINLCERNNVTVKNTEVRAFYDGFCLKYSYHNTIYKNNITDNSHCGIWSIGFSRYNTIQGNNLSNNNHGINLWRESNNNIIYDNIIKDNVHGVWLAGASSGNNVTGNTFINDGMTVNDGWNNVVTNNSVNGKPLVYLEHISDYVVEEEAGQVLLLSCNNITVRNLNLTNTSVGVRVFNTDNSTIIGNNIANNRIGIWIDQSVNNTIQGNNITGNGPYGIISRYGRWSTNNIIQGNRIADTSGWALFLMRFSNNSILENDVVNNKGGIYMVTYLDKPSIYNIIHHNNFINNTMQAASRNPNNTWDDGYPSGGNYWSDYDGMDLYSGPFQNETGSDGIGDTPYVIDGDNQDNFPLIGPWTPVSSGSTNISKGGETYPFLVNSNATILDFQETPGSIKLKVSGETGTSGYVRIIQPVGLNSSNIKVFLNNTKLTFPSTDPPRSISTNGTHYFIYFTFTFNSTYELTVAFPVTGDVDYNGKVNIFDVVMVAMAYQSTPSEPHWNPHCDIIEEYGIINIFDIVLVVMNYGEEWS